MTDDTTLSIHHAHKRNAEIPRHGKKDETLHDETEKFRVARRKKKVKEFGNNGSTRRKIEETKQKRNRRIVRHGKKHGTMDPAEEP